VPSSTPTIVHRKLIITLAAKHRLPAVYQYRFFAAVAPAKAGANKNRGA